jgi:hypothetical protein
MKWCWLTNFNSEFSTERKPSWHCSRLSLDIHLTAASPLWVDSTSHQEALVSLRGSETCNAVGFGTMTTMPAQALKCRVSCSTFVHVVSNQKCVTPSVKMDFGRTAAADLLCPTIRQATPSFPSAKWIPKRGRGQIKEQTKSLKFQLNNWKSSISLCFLVSFPDT